MNADACGPVTPSEVLAVVQELQHLSARAAENGQQMFHFVLSMGVESLADNLEVAGELGTDG